MKHIVIAITLIAFLLPALSANAFGIEYSSVTESSETEAIVRQRTFTTDSYFRCSLSTKECASAAQSTTLGTFVPEPAYMRAYRALLPAGSTRVTRSPDGRYIAFYVPGTASRGKRTFGVMDTTTLTIYTKDEALAYWDLLTEGIRIFAFAPDSKSLVYLSDAIKSPTLYKVDLTALKGTTLNSAKMFSRDYTVAEVAWLDADTIVFVGNRETPHQWSLYRYTISTGALAKVADNVSYDVSVRRAGEAFLFGEASSTGLRPKIYDPRNGTISEFAIPTTNPEVSIGKSVTLSRGLSGVYLLEPSKNSDTLLVWLHGGPFRQSSQGYHPYMSYGGYDWALEKARDADVGVLKIDYPGSFGYGRPFAEALIEKVGVKDVADTETAIADFAKKNRYSKVYLMGNSYGGYLALKLLVDKPSAYAGAFSINGVADWTTMLTALDTSIFNVLFGGTVGDTNANHALYANASIYNNVSDLSNDKVILMHSDKDMTIPFRQSNGLSTFMTQNNKPVELITMSEEDHVFKKPESFKMLCETTLKFVSKSGGSSCDVGL